MTVFKIQNGWKCHGKQAMSHEIPTQVLHSNDSSKNNTYEV